jgi:hypothetical protein
LKKTPVLLVMLLVQQRVLALRMAADQPVLLLHEPLVQASPAEHHQGCCLL